MRTLVLVAAAGCTTGHSGQGDDGGNGYDACSVDVTHLQATACLETTAAVEATTGYTSATDGTVSGEVVESGAYTPITGMVTVPGFAACDGAERIVRILDGNGDLWTVGWSIAGNVDAASEDALPVGPDPVDLAWDHYFGGYSETIDLVVGDATGPRFAFAQGNLNPDALHGALTVGSTYQTCTAVVDSDTWDESALEFSGAGTLTLFSGQSGTLELDDRDLEVVVPMSAWLDGCVDGCGTTEWVGWER